MSDGFVNVNKPAGMTSHDAVNRLRKIFGTRKVGHAGTLDPQASGVLPVAVGSATKFIEYLAAREKSYRAQILFGISTDSGDLEGEVIARAENFIPPTNEQLADVLSNFVGEIEQRPPKFSAIKIHGRKAYDLARKNLPFEMPTRRVKIFRLSLVALTDSIATVDVECGAGTYIRSLAIDIGESLNLPTTLKSLIRTRVGDFKLTDALTFDAIEKIGGSCLLPIDVCLNHLPTFELPAHRVRAFMNGLPTTVAAADEPIVRVKADGKFLGIGRIERGELKSSKIYSTPQDEATA